MNDNQKECLSRIKVALKYYLSLGNEEEPFKGQINIEINCLDNKVMNTSMYVNRGAKKKNIDQYQKMFYTINTR